jgi:tetratricopeptide (TPR) repeat protein
VPLLALLWLSPLSGLAAEGDSAAAGAASEASTFGRHMERAVRLYEALEYEKALHGLTQARALAATVEEQVSVALHRGIVLADLGRRKQALDEFRAGLTLQPEAKLPLQVAPKVQRDFESVRKQVRQKVGTRRAPAASETAAKVEAPPAAPEAPPPATPAPASAEAPKFEPKDLRSKLGAAGSVVGERVGTAVGTVLDKVVGPRKDKDGEPAKDAPAAKQEP